MKRMLILGAGTIAANHLCRRLDARDWTITIVDRDDEHFYHPACKATVDMFKLTKEDFCPQVDSIITVSGFYALAAGGHIIFT